MFGGSSVSAGSSPPPPRGAGGDDGGCRRRLLVLQVAAVRTPGRGASTSPISGRARRRPAPASRRPLPRRCGRGRGDLGRPDDGGAGRLPRSSPSSPSGAWVRRHRRRAQRPPRDVSVGARLLRRTSTRRGLRCLRRLEEQGRAQRGAGRPARSPRPRRQWRASGAGSAYGAVVRFRVRFAGAWPAPGRASAGWSRVDRLLGRGCGGLGGRLLRRPLAGGLLGHRASAVGTAPASTLGRRARPAGPVPSPVGCGGRRAGRAAGAAAAGRRGRRRTSCPAGAVLLELVVLAPDSVVTESVPVGSLSSIRVTPVVLPGAGSVPWPSWPARHRRHTGAVVSCRPLRRTEVCCFALVDRQRSQSGALLGQAPTSCLSGASGSDTAPEVSSSGPCASRVTAGASRGASSPI